MAPIIVSALFGPEDFAWFDALRRRYFPIERNQLAAHLTLFHHLPPTIAPELKDRLRTATHISQPAAMASAIVSLGRGTAIRIESHGLTRIRDDLAEAFAGLLTPQDAAGWRPHVTIQNKVQPAEAAALKRALEADFQPRPIAIVGLACWWYRGGPWELLSKHRFSDRRAVPM